MRLREILDLFRFSGLKSQLLVFLFCIATIAGLQAQSIVVDSVINYDGNWLKKGMPLGVEYYADKSDTLDLKEVISYADKFKKTTGTAPTFWAKGHPYWFKFKIKNSTYINQSFVIELLIPLYDEARFYVIDNNKVVNEQYLDWHVPQLDRAIKHRNFIFPFNLRSHQEVICYVKLRKEIDSIWFPMVVWERNAFDYSYSSRDYHVWGVVTGVLMFVVFFSFLLLFAFKDLLYFYYGIYVFMALSFIYTVQGYFIRFYVDGSFGVAGNRVKNIVSILFLIAGLLFVRKYLQWDLLKTSFFKYATSLLLFILSSIAIFLFTDHLVFKDVLFQSNKPLMNTILSIIFWLPNLYVVFVLLYCIILNHFRKEAIYFLIANVPIASVIFYSSLSSYELVEGSRYIEIEYFAMAFLIEIVVLTVLLAYRLKATQDVAEQFFIEKARAQQHRTEAVLEAEDRERVRIARDLHDGIGQMLAAARMALGNFLAKKNIEDTDIQTSLDLLEDSIREIREISHNMMPGALTKLGLPTALKQFVNRINSLEILQINLQIVGVKERLNEKTEMMLYRIIQEILGNIMRHAEATKVNIELIKHDDELVLIVEDNGKGFDSEKIKNQGIGIKNIASRVEYLNGSVNFDSAMGRGTSVIVEIPLSLT